MSECHDPLLKESDDPLERQRFRLIPEQKPKPKPKPKLICPPRGAKAEKKRDLSDMIFPFEIASNEMICIKVQMSSVYDKKIHLMMNRACFVESIIFSVNDAYSSLLLARYCSHIYEVFNTFLSTHQIRCPIPHVLPSMPSFSLTPFTNPTPIQVRF